MSEIEHENRRPDPHRNTASDDQPDLDWLAERRDRLNVATQETRFRILQKILGHPEQLPTLKELDYFLMGKSESTIRDHLETLSEAGVVTRVELPEERRTRDTPHVFYGLTEEGREALRATGLVETEDVLQEATLRTELRPDVKAYMDAPRPDWAVANPLERET